MFRNITIRQVSFYVAILIVIVNAFILIGFLQLEGQDFLGSISIQRFVFFLLLIFILIFLVVRFFFETFVFRKIKLIYKVISDRKITDDETKPILNANDTSIDHVQLEVAKWATKTKKEITSLKSLETYRKQYVGDISHELKTPIFTIQGYIHTLLEGGIYDEKINLDYLERAARNVERLITIVDDLELINKLELGKETLSFINFDVKKLAEDIIKDFSSTKNEKQIAVKFKDNADQSYHVTADQEAIRQVLNNLITNAIKYGKQNGSIFISFYNMDDRVLIEITDDGIGIEEHHLKHLFDRFYRVDSSRSRAEGGSGLGLSIVKHIVEAHKQTINVRSSLGKGSTFGFTLQTAK